MLKVSLAPVLKTIFHQRTGASLAESVSSELEGPSRTITAITAAFCSVVNRTTVCIDHNDNLHRYDFHFFRNIFMPPPFIMGGGGGGHIASPLSVHTSRTYEKWFPGSIF